VDEFGAGELSGRLFAAADELSELSAALQEAVEDARERRFAVSDPGGLAEVVVDGRPRVHEINLHPEALHGDPDDLDRLLTRLLNDALTQSRTTSGAALSAALPPSIREAAEATTSEGERR
jgi:DNA-binding protein YbaB